MRWRWLVPGDGKRGSWDKSRARSAPLFFNLSWLILLPLYLTISHTFNTYPVLTFPWNHGYLVWWSSELEAAGRWWIWSSLLLSRKSSRVIKIPSNKDHSVKAIEIEKRIYKRLGSHPNIVSVTRIEEKGIVLERAKYGSLRQYLRTSTATMEERIRCCRDVAIALHYVHCCGVKQVDIGIYVVLFVNYCQN